MKTKPDMMPTNITLVLMKKDFNTLDTESAEFARQFEDNFNCVLATAAKRQFKKDDNISCGTSFIRINGYTYYPIGKRITFSNVKSFAKKLKKQSKTSIKFRRSVGTI
jgi:hypothetical protein